LQQAARNYFFINFAKKPLHITFKGNEIGSKIAV